MSDLSCRTATLPEVVQMLDWAAEEGWNPGIDDAAAFYAADPEGFFVAEVDGQPVAAISVVNHSDAHAFLADPIEFVTVDYSAAASSKDAFVLNAVVSLWLTNIANRAGTINNVSTADSDRPPITTEPRPRYSSEPAPGTSTNGSMPNTLVSVDIKIGRSLLRVASRIESRTSIASVLM